MKVLLSWMQQFAPIEGDPEALGAELTDLGLVVESIETVGSTWDGIVVAKVVGLRPHPEADRIQLVDVETGEGGDALQICCGAFNMAVGDLVPLATLGTVMPGGLEIARRKLRGEWSNGMICSASELALVSDAADGDAVDGDAVDGDAVDGDAVDDGILVLDASLSVGDSLADALGAETDVLFDLDVEGNRPDALSIAGVARDLAARLGVPFSIPTPEFAASPSLTADRASVVIGDAALCARFGVRVLDNITLNPSPDWMVRRLEAAGMRSINAIVDISNYVMLEVGQPNHTYDLALVPEGHLGVRMARDGEELVTLDDQTRVLTSNDGVICNRADEPIGLAGVMGGASTEITDATTSVIVEAAVWDRITIAKTSRRLNLRSEASVRFERGADPLGIELALDRFAELAVEICGASVAQGRLVEVGGFAAASAVVVRTDRVNRLLNTELSRDGIAELLDPIGFTATPSGDTDLEVLIPSWRPDSSLEIDVIEEIARHHGYSRSGTRVPKPAQSGHLTSTQQARRRIRRAMIGAGLSEAMPMPFLAPGDLVRAGLVDEGITLANPLVAEESVLRTSLLPGLLKAVAYNQSHRNDDVRLFELGTVFQPSDDALPAEAEWLAVALGGVDALAATSLLYSLGAALGLSGLKVRNSQRDGLHPTRGAEVVFRGRTIGEVGEVDPRALDNYGISGRVGWIQLDTASLLSAVAANAKYRKVSLFPSSEVDLAFVVSDEVAVSDVVTSIEKAGSELLRSVRFLNAFRSESLGDGVRSLAFNLRFQASDRTLTDAEVAERRQAVIDRVQKSNGGALRA